MTLTKSYNQLQDEIADVIVHDPEIPYLYKPLIFRICLDEQESDLIQTPIPSHRVAAFVENQTRLRVAEFKNFLKATQR